MNKRLFNLKNVYNNFINSNKKIVKNVHNAGIYPYLKKECLTNYLKIDSISN